MTVKKYGADEITEEKDEDLIDEIPKFPEQGDKPKKRTKNKVVPVKAIKKIKPIKKAMYNTPDQHKAIVNGLNRAYIERAKQIYDEEYENIRDNSGSARKKEQDRINEEWKKREDIKRRADKISPGIGPTGQHTEIFPNIRGDERDQFADELANNEKERKKESEKIENDPYRGQDDIRYRVQRLAKEKGISEELAHKWVEEERAKDPKKFNDDTVKMLDEDGYYDIQEALTGKPSFRTREKPKTKEESDAEAAKAKADAEKALAEYNKRIKSERAKTILKGAELLGLNLLANTPDILTSHLKNTHRLFMAFFNKKPMTAAAQSLAAIAGGFADAERILKNIDKIYGIDSNNAYSRGIGVGTIKYAMHAKDRIDAKNALNNVASEMDMLFDGVNPEKMTYDDYIDVENKFKKYIMSEMPPLVRAKEYADNTHTKLPYSQLMRLEALQAVSRYIDKEGADLKKKYGYDRPDLVRAREGAIMDEIGLTNISDDPDEALGQIGDAYRQLEKKYGKIFADLKSRKMAGEKFKQDDDVLYAAIDSIHRLRSNISADKKNSKKILDEEKEHIYTQKAKNIIKKFEEKNGLDKLNETDVEGAYNAYVNARNAFDDEFDKTIKDLEKERGQRKLTPEEQTTLNSLKSERKNLDDYIKTYRKKLNEKFEPLKKEISDALMVGGKGLNELTTNEELDEFTNRFFKDDKTFGTKLNGHTLDQTRISLENKKAREKLSPFEDRMLKLLKKYHNDYIKKCGEIPRIFKKEKIKQLNEEYTRRWKNTERYHNLPSGKKAPVLFWPATKGTELGKKLFGKWLFDRFCVKANTDRPNDTSNPIYARNAEGMATHVIIPSDPLQCRAMRNSLIKYRNELVDAANELNKSDDEDDKKLGKDFATVADELERVSAIIHENQRASQTRISVNNDITRTFVENLRYNYGNTPITLIHGYPLGTAGLNIKRAMAYVSKLDEYEKNGIKDKMGREVRYTPLKEANKIAAFNCAMIWMYNQMMDVLTKKSGVMDPFNIIERRKKLAEQLDGVLLIGEDPNDPLNRYDITGEKTLDELLKTEGYGLRFKEYLNQYADYKGFDPNEVWENEKGDKLIKMIKYEALLKTGKLDFDKIIDVLTGMDGVIDKKAEKEKESEYKKIAEGLDLEKEAETVDTELGDGFRKKIGDGYDDSTAYRKCCVGIDYIRLVLESDHIRRIFDNNKDDEELRTLFEKAFTPPGSSPNNGRTRFINHLKKLVTDSDRESSDKIEAIDKLDKVIKMWSDQVEQYLNTDGHKPWSLTKKEKDKALINNVTNAMLSTLKRYGPYDPDFLKALSKNLPNPDNFSEAISGEILNQDDLMNMSNSERLNYIKECVLKGRISLSVDNTTLFNTLNGYRYYAQDVFKRRIESFYNKYNNILKILKDNGVNVSEYPTLDYFKSKRTERWTPQSIIEQVIAIEDVTNKIIKSCEDNGDLAKDKDIQSFFVTVANHGKDIKGNPYKKNRIYKKGDNGVGLLLAGKQAYNMWAINDALFTGRGVERDSKMKLTMDAVSDMMSAARGGGSLSYDVIHNRYDPEKAGLSSKGLIDNMVTLRDRIGQIDKYLDDTYMEDTRFRNADGSLTKLGTVLDTARTQMKETLTRLQKDYYKPMEKSFEKKYKGLGIYDDDEESDDKYSEYVINFDTIDAISKNPDWDKYINKLYKEEAEIIADAFSDYITIKKYFDPKGMTVDMTRLNDILNKISSLYTASDSHDSTISHFREASMGNLGIDFVRSGPRMAPKLELKRKDGKNIEDKDITDVPFSAAFKGYHKGTKKPEEFLDDIDDYLKKKGIKKSDGTLDTNEAYKFIRYVGKSSKLSEAYDRAAEIVFRDLAESYIINDLLPNGTTLKNINEIYKMGLVKKLGKSQVGYLTEIVVRDLFDGIIQRRKIGEDSTLSKDVHNIALKLVEKRLGELGLKLDKKIKKKPVTFL